MILAELLNLVKELFSFSFGQVAIRALVKVLPNLVDLRLGEATDRAIGTNVEGFNNLFGGRVSHGYNTKGKDTQHSVVRSFCHCCSS